MSGWELIARTVLALAGTYFMLEGIGLFRFWSKWVGVIEISLGLALMGWATSFIW